ncbi:trypsin-like peptidase domain-containing protein, partial [Actinopolymorpha sp. NPDC004070]|uniref:S1C family serine protease n=1 Tax=Actinopolymorpha sp. NPDC004070 TaxID=3154548 RepID=UPI00339EB7C2
RDRGCCSSVMDTCVLLQHERLISVHRPSDTPAAIIGAVLVKIQPSDAQAALTALPASRTENAELPKAPQDRVPVIVASAMPSVVEVHVKSIGGSSTGSGTVLTRSGLILTNYHVVATHDLGATQIDVKVGGQHPASQQASIISADPAADLAVIQVTKEGGFKPASLGDSSTVVPGTQVIAIGSPEGLQGSVTTGVVSALDRPVQVEGTRTGQDKPLTYAAIQTDAALNPGNSGGPLLDLDGRVIGINSSVYTPTSGPPVSGIGFAIPINDAEKILAHLGPSA